tara:strand:- start:1288 stop:1449 length:162 start_codon:yes stop_codon:yes gene_type:complete
MEDKEVLRKKLKDEIPEQDTDTPFITTKGLRITYGLLTVSVLMYVTFHVYKRW